MSPVRPAVDSETAVNRGSRRRHVALAAAGLSILALGSVGRGPAVSAQPSQDPTATTIGPLGTSIPAPTFSVATTTVPPTVVVPTTAAAAGPDAGAVAAEDRKILMVVGGLVAVAVALMLLTIRYWRRTRPIPIDAAGVDHLGAAPGPVVVAGTAPVAEEGRHSRRAVAGADHAAADEGWEPRATAEHPAIDVPTPTRRTVRPTSDQRAAALRGAADDG